MSDANGSDPLPAFMPDDDGSDDGRQGRRRRHIVIAAVAAVVAVAVIAVGCYFGVRAYGDARAARAAAAAAASARQERRDAEQKQRRQDAQDRADAEGQGKQDHRTRQLDMDRLDAIVNRYGSDVAVAVTSADDRQTYVSEQGNTRFVAAGLYLPVWLAAYDTDDATARQKADVAMRTMDNTAANEALDGVGDLLGFNQWLVDNGYRSTSFSRVYGDVDDSDQGLENFTSAADAARMLSSVIAEGGDSRMGHDLASEDIRAPKGVRLHGHRGSGLRDAYNFFLAARGEHGTAGVVILTHDVGKATAAKLANEVLDEVADEVLD